jgi:hypothetical protein
MRDTFFTLHTWRWYSTSHQTFCSIGCSVFCNRCWCSILVSFWELQSLVERKTRLSEIPTAASCRGGGGSDMVLVEARTWYLSGNCPFQERRHLIVYVWWRSFTLHTNTNGTCRLWPNFIATYWTQRRIWSWFVEDNKQSIDLIWIW